MALFVLVLPRIRKTSGCVRDGSAITLGAGVGVSPHVNLAEEIVLAKVVDSDG